MRCLLDTHVLLWWLENPVALSEKARSVIKDGKNAIYVSAAVVWEIAIKRSLGKLDIPDNIDAVLKTNRFLPLSITVDHALAVQSLPTHHRDPFDRMLIAQAIFEDMAIITRDLNIQNYQVPTILA